MPRLFETATRTNCHLESVIVGYDAALKHVSQDPPNCQSSATAPPDDGRPFVLATAAVPRRDARDRRLSGKAPRPAPSRRRLALRLVVWLVVCRTPAHSRAPRLPDRTYSLSYSCCFAQRLKRVLILLVAPIAAPSSVGNRSSKTAQNWKTLNWTSCSSEGAPFVSTVYPKAYDPASMAWNSPMNVLSP